MFVVIFSYPSFAQNGIDNWVQELKKTIAQSETFDAEKITRISKLKEQAIKDDDTNRLFAYYLELYNEYAVFNFDSAYHYAKRMQQTAFFFK